MKGYDMKIVIIVDSVKQPPVDKVDEAEIVIDITGTHARVIKDRFEVMSKDDVYVYRG
jgi:hypothetical protein